MKTEKLPTEKSITTTPFPASKKIYVKGKLHNIEVAMREIEVSSGVASKFGKEIKKEKLVVYDTSGPFTDPNISIDVKKGLAPIREKWIMERGDVEQLKDFSSAYGNQRMNDKSLDSLALRTSAQTIESKSRSECFSNALRKKRDYHSRNGIHRHPRKPNDR